MPTVFRTKARVNKDSATIEYVDADEGIALVTPPATETLPVVGGVVVVGGVSYTVTDVETNYDAEAATTYTVTSSAEEAPGGATSSGKPWDARPQLSVSTVNSQMPLVRDRRSNKRLTVSSGEAPDIPPLYNEPQTVITIRRARLMSEADMIARTTAFNQKVNAGTFNLFGTNYADGTLLMTYSAEAAWYKDDIYANETITLQHDKTTHKLKLRDQGHHMKGYNNGAGVQNAGKRYRLPARGECAKVDANGTSSVVYTDAWLNQDPSKSTSAPAPGTKWVYVETPFDLNGAGRPLTGVDVVTGSKPSDQPSQDAGYTAGAGGNHFAVLADISSSDGVYLGYWAHDDADFSELDLEDGF